MSTPQRSKLLHSLRHWKAKAIARRQENEALKKRIVELTQSRDAWKLKAQQHLTEVVELQAEHGSQKNAARPAIAIASRRSRR
jgi:hypothetical protein